MVPPVRGQPYGYDPNQQPPQPILEGGEFRGWRYSDGRAFGAIREGHNYHATPMATSSTNLHPQVVAMRQQQIPPSQAPRWAIHPVDMTPAPSRNGQYLEGTIPAPAAGPFRIQGHANTYQQHTPSPALQIQWDSLRPRVSRDVEAELAHFGLNEPELDAAEIGTRVTAMATHSLRLQRACQLLQEDYEQLRHHACLGCGCQGSSQTAPESNTVSSWDAAARSETMEPTTPIGEFTQFDFRATNEHGIPGSNFDVERAATRAHTAAEAGSYHLRDLPTSTNPEEYFQAGYGCEM